jgi:hypothetical protein
MATADAPVVVGIYPTRDYATELVAVLRKEGIATIAVPSDRHAGEWDVVVPAREADRVDRIVQALLAPH